MADEVNAKDSGGGFEPHQEGQFAAVCADVINLGQRIEQFPGSPARIVDKCALVFVTDTDGETKEISREMSVSMNSKAALRAFLEAWRGKSYSDDQARAGVPLHKLVGHGALISVEHKVSGKGRTYGNIKAIAPLPKKMEAPAVDGYTRAEFWQTRKDQYAEEARKWAAQLAKSDDTAPLDESDADVDDTGSDDCPF